MERGGGGGSALKMSDLIYERTWIFKKWVYKQEPPVLYIIYSLLADQAV